MKKILLLFIVPIFLVAQDATVTAIESMVESGMYPEALSQIQSALEKSPDNVGLLLLGAKTAVKLDDLNVAKDYMTTANQIDPSNQEVLDYWNELKVLGDLISECRKTIEGGFFEESLQCLDSTVVKFPEFAMSYYMKGMVYYKQDDFANAIENFNTAARLNPFDEGYQDGIANIGRNMYNLGNEWMRLKDYKQAIDYYQKAIDYYPEFTDSYFRIGYAYYKSNQLDKAKSYIMTLIDTDNSHSKARKLLGDVEAKLGDLDAAVKWYSEATTIDPNYNQAYYALGKILARQGRNDEAVVQLQKAVDIDPDYTIAYELLGSIYQDKGDLDSAIMNYQKAVFIDSKAYTSYWRMSVCYNEQKDYSKARTAAKQCLNEKDNYAAAQFELGLAEKCLGNKAAAFDAFNKAKSDPDWRKSVEFQLKNIEESCE